MTITLKFVGLWLKVRSTLVVSAAMQSAPTDKLLKPPRGGGRLKEKFGFRNAERCLRSLSRQISAIQMKFPEEDMAFITKSDRLLGV